MIIYELKSVDLISHHICPLSQLRVPRMQSDPLQRTNPKTLRETDQYIFATSRLQLRVSAGPQILNHVSNREVSLGRLPPLTTAIAVFAPASTWPTDVSHVGDT